MRSDALKWLKENYGNTAARIYTSKYYTPEESWPKIPVWFFNFSLSAIDAKQYDYVNLVCQVAPGINDYHYLRVPTKFLNEHLKKFHRIKENISLYLSAHPDTLFIEERGEGRLDFSKFIVQR